ncbi:hypothetical protein [Paratractidigestivibacter sp.]|uniref:hypothetical protein n=1 Tax=Paratractidigestivibacter sp. TaxID=2847316 RepID=UPI002ABD4E00|nr:hypothetical protein [Paratractidigestivibacter sp.]
MTETPVERRAATLASMRPANNLGCSYELKDGLKIESSSAYLRRDAARRRQGYRRAALLAGPRARREKGAADVASAHLVEADALPHFQWLVAIGAFEEPVGTGRGQLGQFMPGSFYETGVRLDKATPPRRAPDQARRIMRNAVR